MWSHSSKKLVVAVGFGLLSLAGMLIFVRPVFALDPAQCAEVYGKHYTSCPFFYKDGFEKACPKAIGSFATKLNDAFKGNAPSCGEMFFLYYSFTNETLDKPPTDLTLCVKELASCAGLFLSCQGNTGIIDMNNLEEQCSYFLDGGKKNWSQLIGTDLCGQALKSDGPIGKQCQAYQAGLEKVKVDAGLLPSKDTSEAEYKQALADVQSNASGLNKLGTTDVKVVVGRVIKAAMGVMGSLALVMFVYGGILWMVSRGESDQAGKARQILVWSTLGVVVIFSSYALLDIVFEVFR